jgi:glyoxylase-like metal-dependent hydrolase (beta-lactamase superfamily II)
MKIDILVQGYAHSNMDGTYTASSTTTLLRDEEKLVLVDPGCNPKELTFQLKKRDLSLEDIKVVFLTHFHLDHVLNIRLFPNADIYDGSVMYQGDEETFYNGKIPHTDIETIATPGHATEQFSLKIIDDTLGKVCIAQDLFWWEDGKQKSGTYEDLLNLEDPFANDLVALKESRNKVLDWADWIVPGHGVIFKNPTKKN